MKWSMSGQRLLNSSGFRRLPSHTMTSSSDLHSPKDVTAFMARSGCHHTRMESRSMLIFKGSRMSAKAAAVGVM